jgi:transglutaminase-like putative cysteine protease
VSGSADGTIRRFDQPLERGDGYSVRAYVPDPSAREMRRAPAEYDLDLLQYTRVSLPLPGENAIRRDLDTADSPAAAGIDVPLRGSGYSDAGAGRALAGSDYAGTYRLAKRLTAGAPTVYDAVKAVERHLANGFTYSERPPSQPYPLEAFLIEDKIGYCQQFSGAMALMLRMSGIPARVVSGFSPGSFNKDTSEYRVRDLDAHSWVEVYFNDIGWVTFDPTPATAPADRAGQGLSDPRGDRPLPGVANAQGSGAPNSDRGLDPAANAAGGDGAGRGQVALLALLAATTMAAAGYAGWRLRRRSRRHDPDAGLRELERALPRLGWPVPAGTTLLELERRLGRMAGPGAAGYVARLREGRYSPRGARPPGRAARRALRRELTVARGPLARLRGFLALPPRGPAV